MGVTLGVTVFGVLVAAMIALIVAYMQRKQMRQIEAYRLDPKVGLIPPQHPFTKFVKRHDRYIIMSVIPVYQLVQQFFIHSPVTHVDVLMVAINVGTLV